MFNIEFEKDEIAVINEMVGTFGKNQQEIVFKAISLLYTVFQQNKNAKEIIIKKQNGINITIPLDEIRTNVIELNARDIVNEAIKIDGQLKADIHELAQILDMNVNQAVALGIGIFLKAKDNKGYVIIEDENKKRIFTSKKIGA